MYKLLFIGNSRLSMCLRKWLLRIVILPPNLLTHTTEYVGGQHQTVMVVCREGLFRSSSLKSVVHSYAVFPKVARIQPPLIERIAKKWIQLSYIVFLGDFSSTTVNSISMSVSIASKDLLSKGEFRSAFHSYLISSSKSYFFYSYPYLYCYGI